MQMILDVYGLVAKQVSLLLNSSFVGDWLDDLFQAACCTDNSLNPRGHTIVVYLRM